MCKFILIVFISLYFVFNNFLYFLNISVLHLVAVKNENILKDVC